MMKNPTNETSPSKQTDEDSGKPQSTEELSDAHQCSSCAITEKTITNLRDDLTAVQKKLLDFDKVIAERDMLVIKLENYAHIDEELEKLRQRVDKSNAMKTENEKLNVKVADLVEQHHKQMKNYEETIKRLNETVDRISSENKELHVRMEGFVQQHKKEAKKDQEAINRPDRLKETVVRISSENRKLCDKVSRLEEQHQSEAKKNQETINRLNEAVNRISSENQKLHVRIADLVQQKEREAKKNQETINRLNEAVVSISSENKETTELVEKWPVKAEDNKKSIKKLNETVDMILSENEKLHFKLADPAKQLHNQAKENWKTTNKEVSSATFVYKKRFPNA
jgi:chromosome segregation ATPase